MDAVLIIFLVLIAATLFLIAFLIEIFWGLYPLLFWGAIYVATPDEKVEKMIKFLDIKPGQKIVDLGAGNGKLVIAAAGAGAQAHGYEINPFLVFFARKKIREMGLEGKAFMHLKNLWRQDLSSFDGIVIYAMNHMMKKLKKKFQKELKTGVKIVSNYFLFTDWEPVKKDGDIHLYVYKKLEKI